METTYRIVWRAFMGGQETLASGLTGPQAQTELANLPPLPMFGGSYGIEVEEHADSPDNAPELGIKKPR